MLLTTKTTISCRQHYLLARVQPGVKSILFSVASLLVYNWLHAPPLMFLVDATRTFTAPYEAISTHHRFV